MSYIPTEWKTGDIYHIKVDGGPLPAGYYFRTGEGQENPTDMFYAESLDDLPIYPYNAEPPK